MASVEIFARTEVGNTRERNEDTFLVLDLSADAAGLRPEQRVVDLGPPGLVLAVCDGMGGAAAGDVAAQMAASGLENVARAAAPLHEPEQIEAMLVHAVASTNREISAYAQADPSRHGMGTTMTACVLSGPTLCISQIGDSRAYLRRGRRLQQLTTDQSVVGKLVASGQLTPEQARTYDQRNVLLQALGVQPVVSPELVRAQVMAGDVLLLCSDGLCGPLTDPEIVELMLKYQDPLRCCRALTEAACARGGPDNVTVVLARFVGEGLPVPSGPSPIVVSRREVTAGND